MYKNTNCQVCKKISSILCEQCNNPTYFCSKAHLNQHKQKFHKSNSVSHKLPTNNNTPIFQNQNLNNKNYSTQNNFRNFNEYNQHLRKEIINKMTLQDYTSAISLINEYVNLSKEHYQSDNHPQIIEMLYTLAECHLNLSNLEESKNILNEITSLTENSNNNINLIFRQKACMLLGAILLNIGEYNNALKYYFICETDLPKICKEPELNVKLSSVYLNISLCFIYLKNKNIAEKYLKKGLSQTEGILGNDTIHKLNADIFENLGVVYELMNRFKDSLIFYKKSLKLKFNLYGEIHDEVLELQYKISGIYLSLKQFQQAEEILSSIVELILKKKIQNSPPEAIYRYSTYFYTYGVVLIKLNKMNNAKIYLNKVLEIVDGFLLPNDPWIYNINDLLRLCDSKSNK